MVITLASSAIIANSRKVDRWAMWVGIFSLCLAIVVILVLLYKMLRCFHYPRKIEICEQKISDINSQIAQKLGEIENFS